MILDSSVIVAWFLPDEPLADRAMALRDRVLSSPADVVVPRICWTEVAHALVRASRRGRLPAAAVDPAAGALGELMALLPTTDVDPVAAMRVALERGVGVYGATYLNLARSSGRPLVTSDDRLADAGIEGALDVIRLGDLPAALMGQDATSLGQRGSRSTDDPQHLG